MSTEAIPRPISAVEAAQTRPVRYGRPRRRIALLVAALATAGAAVAGGVALGTGDGDAGARVGSAAIAANRLEEQGTAELAAGRVTQAHALLTEAYRLGNTSPRLLAALDETQRAAVARTRTLEGGDGAVRTLVASPDGTALLAVRDGGVDVWRIDGSGHAWLTLAGEYMAGAVWTPDGTRIVAWSPDGIVRLWNASSGALVDTVQAGLGEVAGIAFELDGLHAFTIETDGTRRLFDLRHPGVIAVERGEPPAAAPAVTELSVPERWTAYLDRDGVVRIVSAR